ncbi:NrsF family protein [Variovorax sp. dw_308]|uniref:NrsF family protein n=1 Tax=Variovorax sp. dw_308 TaxID=2721546 RepID=UPI001C454FD9
MIHTSDLIQSLAADIRPVRRLRPPAIRASGWLLIAGAIMVGLYFGKGLRPAFAERMSDTTFLIGMLASLATGVLAAFAAFLVSLPDRSQRWLLLPLPPLVVWLSSIGYQCLAGWVGLPPGAVTPEAAAGCASTLLVTSLPLAVAMLFMLRYAAAFRPVPVIIMGSLAVSALTCTALAMFHPLDATVMVLGWNLATAAIVTGVALLINRRASRQRRRHLRTTDRS